MNMLTMVKMDDIDASAELNSRGEMKILECVPLAKDIEQNGLLQPIVVRRFQDSDRKWYKWEKPYQLVAGFRRYSAHIILKKEEISCVISECTFERARFLNLAENIQRKDLNLLQEAKSVRKLQELGYTQEEIADELKQSRGWAQIRCKLLDLPEEIQIEAAAGLINQTHIRELSMLPNKEEQYTLVKKIKDAALRGRKLTKEEIRAPKMKKEAKRQRTKVEMLEMIDHIIDTLKGNFGTRCLSWASGEISTDELYNDIQLQCDVKGVPYVRPQS